MRSRRRTTQASGRGSAARGLSLATAKLRRETSLAGNAAMVELLERTRVHSDPQSAREADALDAAAFTRGGEIFLGSAAPPLDSFGGVDLLRHELAHVVQQTNAHGQTGAPINQAGDAFEVAAESGSAAPAGAPPAIQRQWADDNLAHYSEKVEVLKQFFEDLKARSKGSMQQGLDDTAKAQLTALAGLPDPTFKGPGTDPKIPSRLLAIGVLLKTTTSNDPGDLAVKVSNILPASMDPKVLAKLRPLNVNDPPRGVEKLIEAIKKTTPNPDPNQPGPSNQEKRDEKARQHDIGETQLPTIPLGQIPDVVNEMKKPDPPKRAPRPAEQSQAEQKPQQAAAPAAGAAQKAPEKPDVITGASPIVPTAPPPAQQEHQKDLGAMPSFIDTAIQGAQERGRATADLMLGDTLKSQQDTVIAQVQRVLQMHAGDKAFRVTSVNVYMGGKLVKTVRLGAR